MLPARYGYVFEELLDVHAEPLRLLVEDGPLSVVELAVLDHAHEVGLELGRSGGSVDNGVVVRHDWGAVCVVRAGRSLIKFYHIFRLVVFVVEALLDLAQVNRVLDHGQVILAAHGVRRVEVGV